jgi:hypothetical protein
LLCPWRIHALIANRNIDIAWMIFKAHFWCWWSTFRVNFGQNDEELCSFLLVQASITKWAKYGPVDYNFSVSNEKILIHVLDQVLKDKVWFQKGMVWWNYWGMIFLSQGFQYRVFKTSNGVTWNIEQGNMLLRMTFAK